MGTPANDSFEQRPTLTICISTFNRAEFLRQMLEAVLPQTTKECEVLVVDNASTDGTSRVVSDLMDRSARLRYVRKDTNDDLDRNWDRAVEISRGDYCWLTSDDDLIRPGAIAAVLSALRDEPSAVVVNYEFRDFTMTHVVPGHVLDFDADRTYGPWEAERMFIELGDSIRYIGALIMRRTLWLARQRELYIGSYYGFVGMMYQERFPRHVHVIAKPCVAYRLGNTAEFAERLAEIIFAKWPSLVASLPIAYSTKRKLHSSEPWKHPYLLLVWRGIGLYSYDQYRRWIRPRLHRVRDRLVPAFCALLPRSLVAWTLILFLSTRANKLRQLDGMYLAVLRLTSSSHFRIRTPQSSNAEGQLARNAPSGQ